MRKIIMLLYLPAALSNAAFEIRGTLREGEQSVCMDVANTRWESGSIVFR